MKLFYFILAFGVCCELVCGRKNGRCPDIVEKFEESCTYEHQCYSDLNCEGIFKCCEDDCGISRCVRPETDAAVITTGKEICMPFENSYVTAECHEVQTKFCYKDKCTRCCFHKNSCNPDPRIFTTTILCNRELCRSHVCAQQGSECKVNSTTDNPHCVCKESCPVRVDPVCGEDGRTYDNKCHLDKHACENKRRMKVRYLGLCVSRPEINVIRQDGKTKDIKTGEVLKLSCKTFEKEAKLKWFKRNGVKLIALPKSMISSGDSNSVIFKIQGTVSAHSGTYVCEKTLRTRRVSAQVNITVKLKESLSSICRQSKDAGQCSGNFPHYYYDVKEDSCKLFQYGGCSGNNNNFERRADCEKTCKGTRFGCAALKKQSEAKCPDNIKDECSKDEDCGGRLSCCSGCVKICFDESLPIKYRYRSAPTIKPVTEAMSNPQKPAEFKCGRQVCRMYAECRTAPSGDKGCVCPRVCDFLDNRPVCGTDSETGVQKNYPSECFLKITACRLQKYISMADGPCASTVKEQQPKGDLCALRRCPRYGYCAINPFTHQPHCVCFRLCDFKPDILCASDGQTYLNECIMKVQSCRKDYYVTKVSKGPCTM